MNVTDLVNEVDETYPYQKNTHLIIITKNNSNYCSIKILEITDNFTLLLRTCYLVIGTDLIKKTCNILSKVT